MDQVRITLEGRESKLSAFIIAVIMGALAVVAFDNDLLEKTWLYAAVGAFVFALGNAIIVHGTTQLVLKREALEVYFIVSGIILSRTIYPYKKMSNIHKRSNVEYHVHRRYVSFFLFSIPYREYEYDPVVIFFNFNGQEVRIGRGKKEFGAEMIVKEIKRRKSVLENETEQ